MQAAKTLLGVRPEGIPTEMKSFKHWVVWKAKEKEDGGIDKVLHDPRSGRQSSSTDSRTWATFPEAWDAYDKPNSSWSGIGFVFSSGDPFVGIDFDNVRDPETGEVSDKVLAFISRFENHYVEASPSGTGLHLITCGKLREGKKKGNFELYGQERFFCMTGEVCDV